eukprot:TRINITY_DN3071_c0_g1_i4.p1 TRINITY_DN3071_c0_g1~~TRINITY_DN3071_c0_g1_i4.p1  ORF type:complete len:280 (+),score=46.64 TRINITY_DN3071_c0_g1_i4:54-893(+)
MGGLLLYVRLHGQVIPVDAEPDATVQQLMQRVAEAVGGEPPLLQFQGADLNPEDLISDTGVSQEATLDAVRRRVFRYEHDFDENGLFYYIGTLGLQEPWKNPDSERRLVSCQKKPEWFSPSSSPASNLVGREGSYCRTEKALRAHFEVDISRVGSIAPTHYTLRHGRVQETYVLRSWELLGSADGEEWTLLDRREESPLRREDSEPQQGSPPYFTRTFDVPTAAKACTRFRIVGLQNGDPQDMDTEEDCFVYLHLSGLELYGSATIGGIDRAGSGSLPT